MSVGAADIARALSERHPHAPRAADKARWDKLRASFLAAYRAAQDLEIKLRVINPALKGGAFERTTWNTQSNPFPASSGRLKRGPLSRLSRAIRTGQ